MPYVIHCPHCQQPKSLYFHEVVIEDTVETHKRQNGRKPVRTEAKSIVLSWYFVPVVQPARRRTAVIFDVRLRMVVSITGPGQEAG